MSIEPELGEDPEDFERRRIRARVVEETADAIVEERGFVREREVEPVQMPALKLELTEAMKPLVAEAFGQLVSFLSDLKEDIRAQTALMRTMDAPIEAIAGSHERASESFETLRVDIGRIGLETPQALRELAAVVDTAGLGKAQSRMEKRWEDLGRLIETRLTKIEKTYEKGFKALCADLVKVLHELERINSRALKDAQRRAAGV